MPFGLKSVWIQLVTEVIIVAWFIYRFSDRYAAGVFDGPDGHILLGRSLLWFIAATTVVLIAGHFVVVAIGAIAEGGKEPDTTTDERDKTIEFKGERVSQAVAGVGMLGAFILLAFGSSVALVIAIFYASCLVGPIIGNTVKIRSYAGG